MEFTGLDMRKIYPLAEPPLASGGEGKIHTVRGETDKLAKVYHHPEQLEQDKIRYMVLETQNEYGRFISRMIAWPIDALVGDGGQIYGFVMPRFPGVTKLSEILPDQGVDWGKRVIIAWNLCEIVQDVEKMNQCIGDMNPSNFGVDMDSGHVYAFDADSFHFRAPTGRLFPCHVGIAEYYAPELQRQITRGQDMRTLDPEHTFTRETDRFALAVLIFQLLFSGYHPFSARRLENYGSSTVVHRQATNILNKVCAYFNPQYGTGIPKDAPPIDIVPSKMQQMFRRAFLTEDRPSATEWQGALTELSKSLRRCSRQHYYYSQLPECPWCKKENASPPPSSPSSSSGGSGTRTTSGATGKGTAAARTTSGGTGTGTAGTRTTSGGPKTAKKSGGGLKPLLLIACVVFGIWFWPYYNKEPSNPNPLPPTANPTGKESAVEGVWAYHRYIHSGTLGKKELADEITFGFDNNTMDVTWITEKVQKPYWMDISKASYEKMDKIYSEWKRKYTGLLENPYETSSFRNPELRYEDDSVSVTFYNVNFEDRLSKLESAGFLDSSTGTLKAVGYGAHLEKKGYKEGDYFE